MTEEEEIFERFESLKSTIAERRLNDSEKGKKERAFVARWVFGILFAVAIFLLGWGLGARYTHPAIELQKAIAPERKDHQLEFFAPGFSGDCLAFYVDGTPIMRADAISKAKEHPITLKCYLEE